MAQNAVKAEQQAQATATERDQERAELEQIPLPTKSLYIDVHEPSRGPIPFSPSAPTLSLCASFWPTPTPAPSAREPCFALRPPAARSCSCALPTWTKPLPPFPPARGITAASSPSPNRPPPRPRTAPVRRNVEAVIRQLNDLGIVVEEWPARLTHNTVRLQRVTILP